MDRWMVAVVIPVVLLQLVLNPIIHIGAESPSRSSEKKEAFQLVIPGKGHVEWLPHPLRPPLQEIHSVVELPTLAFRHRSKRQMTDTVNNTGNEFPANLTEPIPTSSSRRVSITDKEIVVIVVCSSIGLVICLLGAAISAKFYWKKVRRDSGGDYHGVMQKDPSGIPDVSGLQSYKDKDGRLGHANMFAQIDEMDEEGSCPSSPLSKEKIMQNGGEIKIHAEEIATNPGVVLNGNSQTNHLPAVETEPEVNNEVIENADVITTTVDVEMLTADESSLAGSAVAVEDEVAPVVVITPREYCRTGLSQSDCSLSSYTSVNPTYKYGNQTAYLAGYYGYPCIIDDFISSATDITLSIPTLLAPPISAKIFDFPTKKEDEDPLLLTDEGESLADSISPGTAEESGPGVDNTLEPESTPLQN